MPVVFGTASSLPASSPLDGTTAPIAVGKQGDIYISQMHGAFYTNTYRQNCFIGSTLVAGIVVPFIAATLASKFSLNNPVSSGKVVEPIDINLLQVPGTANIMGEGIAFQGNCSTTSGVPTLTTATAAGIRCAAIGSPVVPGAGVYTAATLTNVGIANLTPVIWIWNNVATTVITQGPTNYAFDGKIVMPPDCISALVASINATQAAAVVSIAWAEWPV